MAETDRERMAKEVASYISTGKNGETDRGVILGQVLEIFDDISGAMSVIATEDAARRTVAERAHQDALDAEALSEADD